MIWRKSLLATITSSWHDKVKQAVKTIWEYSIRKIIVQEDKAVPACESVKNLSLYIFDNLTQCLAVSSLYF